MVTASVNTSTEGGMESDQQNTDTASVNTSTEGGMEELSAEY